MTFATWKHIGVDRMACAWFILRFVDPKAKFAFVERGADIPRGSVPFDIPGVEFSHHGGHCSFHALVRKHKPKDKVLARMARVVDAADIPGAGEEPWAAGLDALCSGLRLAAKSDREAVKRGCLIYDALHARLSA